MRRSRYARLAAALSIAVALTACGNSGGGSSGSKTPYRIDWIGDLTAAVAINGVPDLNGFKTVIDTTNASGGVNGHKIDLVATDSASDVAKGQVNYTNAVSAGTLGIFGGIESAVWVPLAPRAQQDKVPMVNLSITDNYIEPAQPYLYSINLSYAAMANLQIGFIKNYLIKNNQVPASPTVAVYHYTSPAVTTLDSYYKSGLDKLGWKLATTQNFSTTATDVSSQASAVAAAKPDVVITDLLDSTAALDVKTLRQKGYQGPIVDFVGASAPKTLQAISDAGYYTLRAYTSTVDTDVKGISTVTSQAKKTGNTTDMDSVYFSYGYVNAALAVAALKLCGDGCTADKLNTALQKVGKVDVNGLNSDVQLSATRHRAVTQGEFFQYDPAKGKEAPVGSWLDGSTTP